MRDADAWQLLHGEELGYPSGTLETYCKRGWCRLEMLAALAPKRFSTGAWRLGSVNLRFRMHHDPEDPGTGLLMRAEHILNPGIGVFDDQTAASEASAAKRSHTLCCSARWLVHTCDFVHALPNHVHVLLSGRVLSDGLLQEADVVRFHHGQKDHESMDAKSGH